MRHSTKLAPRDELQRLPSLESQAVLGDIHFDDLACARLDVQARLGVRRLGQFRQRRRGIGQRRGIGRLIDEHGGCQTSETTVVEVCRAPVIIIFCLGVSSRGRVGREVMQQPGLSGQAGFHHVLEVSFLVAVDVGEGVAVAGAGDERGGVDDECAELLEAAAESRKTVCWRPDIGGCVFGQIVEVVRGGALEVGVLVEGTVDVVGAFEGVEVAGPEGFFAAGPADEVFGSGACEGFYCVSI